MTPELSDAEFMHHVAARQPLSAHAFGLQALEADATAIRIGDNLVWRASHAAEENAKVLMC